MATWTMGTLLCCEEAFDVRMEKARAPEDCGLLRAAHSAEHALVKDSVKQALYIGVLNHRRMAPEWSVSFAPRYGERARAMHRACVASRGILKEVEPTVRSCAAADVERACNQRIVEQHAQCAQPILLDDAIRLIDVTLRHGAWTLEACGGER